MTFTIQNLEQICSCFYWKPPRLLFLIERSSTIDATGEPLNWKLLHLSSRINRALIGTLLPWDFCSLHGKRSASSRTWRMREAPAYSRRARRRSFPKQQTTVIAAFV